MAKVISKKEVGQKYEETEKERKKGKLIEAENVEKALRNTK